MYRDGESKKNLFDTMKFGLRIILLSANEATKAQVFSFARVGSFARVCSFKSLVKI